MRPGERNKHDRDKDKKQKHDRAEDRKLRRNKKSRNIYFYKGFLRMLNKTYGELDEWRERWKALRDNTEVLVDRKGKPSWVEWKRLTKDEKTEALNEMLAGNYDRVRVDGDGLIQDLALNEAQDIMIGNLSAAERELLEREFGRGIQDLGNMSTWINRAHKRAEAGLKEIYDAPRVERDEEYDDGVL